MNNAHRHPVKILSLLLLLYSGASFAERLSLAGLQAEIDALEAQLNALYAQLADLETTPGADGLNCWDANGNGIADAAEDLDGDGQWDAADCAGAGGDFALILDLISDLGARLELLEARLENVDTDGDGFTPAQGDCDDVDSAVHPEASEVIGDGIDNDCDGNVDLLADNDGDGFTVEDGDCDNFNPDIYPGAPELPDGLDNDCDGTLADEDRDGDGIAPIDGDCNDSNNYVYPGAPELSDGLDNDCDGTLDDEDRDGDGLSKLEGDCNDFDRYIYPGAPERPNTNSDDNCNGTIEDKDRDGDGFTKLTGDCDDRDGNVRPDQTFYFSNSSSGVSTFDYNCNGNIERRLTDTSGCVNRTCGNLFSGTYSCFDIGQGWIGGIPSCGQIGNWSNEARNRVNGNCANFNNPLLQGCR